MPGHPEVDRAAVGRRIREARERKGLSQGELGARIGKQGHQVWRYEDGRNLLGPDVLVAFAEELGVSARWILYGTGEESSPAETRVERDDQILRAVEEFVASLEDDELAEYREHDEEWGKGLAFKDLRTTLGLEVTPSLVRRLWIERRGQRSGKLRAPPKVAVEPRPGRVKLARGPKR